MLLPPSSSCTELRCKWPWKGKNIFLVLHLSAWLGTRDGSQATRSLSLRLDTRFKMVMKVLTKNNWQSLGHTQFRIFQVLAWSKEKPALSQFPLFTLELGQLLIFKMCVFTDQYKTVKPPSKQMTKQTHFWFVLSICPNSWTAALSLYLF